MNPEKVVVIGVLVVVAENNFISIIIIIIIIISVGKEAEEIALLAQKSALLEQVRFYNVLQ